MQGDAVVCGGRSSPVVGAGHAGVDVDASAGLEVVDGFCCLCGVLGVGGTPLTSNRHHRSSGDCLEGKGENYQVCSVQYCVQQLCTVRCTHI